MFAFSPNKLINIGSSLAPGICVSHFIQGSVSTINVSYQNVIKTRFTARNLLVSCGFLPNTTGKWVYVITTWPLRQQIHCCLKSVYSKILYLRVQIFNRSFIPLNLQLNSVDFISIIWQPCITFVLRNCISNNRKNKFLRCTCFVERELYHLVGHTSKMWFNI